MKHVYKIIFLVIVCNHALHAGTLRKSVSEPTISITPITFKVDPRYGRTIIDGQLTNIRATGSLLPGLHESYEVRLEEGFYLHRKSGYRTNLFFIKPHLIGIRYGSNDAVSCYIISENGSVLHLVPPEYFYKMRRLNEIEVARKAAVKEANALKQAATRQVVQQMFESELYGRRLDKRLKDSESKKRM